ncbi:MAG: SsrA-binding protein SmpB [Candidatus Buchananbacteria bacterium]|nr:SsrA-binding protein SmpB [Candidatus Buchananbacteria bacterium]
MPVLAINKKAKFDYEILETFEAGIALSGQEVKSVRQKQASLKGAYITINKNQEVFLINATIPAYKMAGPLPDYNPTRPRKLLLNQKEITYLAGKLQQAGLTLVPISLYTKHNKIKLEIALVKGKKKADKRQQIKERDDKRKIQRLLKNKFQ